MSLFVTAYVDSGDAYAMKFPGEFERWHIDLLVFLKPALTRYQLE